MEQGPDLYARLKVGRSASNKEIKLAYLDLAKQIHPDKLTHLGGDEHKLAVEKFKRLLEAYETLSDSAKRRQYDLKTLSGVRTPQTPAAPKCHQRPSPDLNQKSNGKFNFEKRRGFFFFLKLSVCLSVLAYSLGTQLRAKIVNQNQIRKSEK